MEFRTRVETEALGFEIQPCEEILLVGSCFADEIGRHFRDEGFPTTANPFGTMYNPVSILHTLQRYKGNIPRIVFLTLGTNHVYKLKATGEIVDNCEKRPQSLFQEEKLTVEECRDYLLQSIDLLHQRNAEVQVILTVSPIRYKKYGYHGSQLSKATLLLACQAVSDKVSYFPAYEIFMDELRDYRFYAADMLHPSEQAVAYIWERLVDCCFSKTAKRYLEEWRPLKQILEHRPFNPESDEYRQLIDKTMSKVAELRKKHPTFAR